MKLKNLIIKRVSLWQQKEVADKLCSLLPMIILLSLLTCTFSACNTKQTADFPSEIQNIGFFGDSTCTVISSNRVNGYQIKILISKDIALMNLTRGDSINVYVPIEKEPDFLRFYIEFADSDLEPYTPVINKYGTYVRKINIPTEKGNLGQDIFFMDVDFDGEVELLIGNRGFNVVNYLCYDISKSTDGSASILAPMSEPPYNNFVSDDGETHDGEIYTEFDYKNRTIHIVEQIGCCSHVESWCKAIKDDIRSNRNKLVILRQEYVSTQGDGSLVTERYERINGELQPVDTIIDTASKSASPKSPTSQETSPQ